MSVAIWRFDYVKFIVSCEIGRTNHLLNELREAYYSIFPKGDFEKVCKVHAIHTMDPYLEATCIDIWGEAAQLVTKLDFFAWAVRLQRLDVRGEDWDATEEGVINLGQHFQRHLTTWNVHVYNTKPASKRMGRDRGGKGFTIGSRKSQFHFTVYAKPREKVAVEYRMVGPMLSKHVYEAIACLGYKAQVVDLWQWMKTAIVGEGQERLARCFENTGLGTYYPVLTTVSDPGIPPAQLDFDTQVAMLGTDPDGVRSMGEEGAFWDEAGPGWRP